MSLWAQTLCALCHSSPEICQVLVSDDMIFYVLVSVGEQHVSNAELSKNLCRVICHLGTADPHRYIQSQDDAQVNDYLGRVAELYVDADGSSELATAMRELAAVLGLKDSVELELLMLVGSMMYNAHTLAHALIHRIVNLEVGATLSLRQCNNFWMQ